MKLPNGDFTQYENVAQGFGSGVDQEKRNELRTLLGHFKGKRVVTIENLALDAYGGGDAIDEAYRFVFDDNTSVVLLPQDGDSDARYCTLEILDDAEWNAHAAVSPPLTPAP